MQQVPYLGSEVRYLYVTFVYCANLMANQAGGKRRGTPFHRQVGCAQSRGVEGRIRRLRRICPHGLVGQTAGTGNRQAERAEEKRRSCNWVRACPRLGLGPCGVVSGKPASHHHPSALALPTFRPPPSQPPFFQLTPTAAPSIFTFIFLALKSVEPSCLLLSNYPPLIQPSFLLSGLA